MNYEYEMFFDDDGAIPIHGWWPIATECIKNQSKIQEYIDKGILRRIDMKEQGENKITTDQLLERSLIYIDALHETIKELIEIADRYEPIPEYPNDKVIIERAKQFIK